MSVGELDDYFKKVELPEEAYLHPAVKIIDMQQFLSTSFIQVEAHGKTIPSYSRLMELKAILDNAASMPAENLAG